MQPRLFCFGLGYSAEVLARHCRAAGWQIAGTARETDRLAYLANQGFETFRFDRQHGLPGGALAGATHILSSVPPDADGDPVLDLARPAILAAGAGLSWIGYLSTTGVYGDHGGGWVDETSPLRPTASRSWHRVNAEAAWLDLWRGSGLPTHLFRLAGIYGPGRSALDEVRSGRARRIVKPGQVFSRIHVEDIAGVLQVSMAKPAPGSVYNVCDDEAAPPQDVIAFACDLLGVPPPPETPFDQAVLSPMAQSFWADNRRVRNDRIKRDLGVALRYPTYREGLRALAE
ncbi:SDR family oxidoreductase [Telmatospirillum siberiense]|uniref:NAD(P)-dependent oxidoreductase n=1 Tax=Telmatospirillum siberiense TaxID=382514 RepID=A0A2N3PQX0_9PROT|nr:SDR family oxidoreductase [Telmatospirillum siberiense]PKU22797.1 NAD(P)-dependent oxidoreductase [Telmatospirillum siberiense]